MESEDLVKVEAEAAVVEQDFTTNKTVREIVALLSKWRQTRFTIGQKLMALAASGVPLSPLISYLASEGDISRADLVVAHRWACGELGTREQGEMLVRKVAASKLATMPTEAIASMLEGEHPVYSPAQGRIVSRSFEAMSEDEARANTNHHGLIPVSAQSLDENPPWRAPRAVAYRMERKGEIVFLTADPSRGIRVSRKLAREALEEEGEDTE